MELVREIREIVVICWLNCHITQIVSPQSQSPILYFMQKLINYYVTKNLITITTTHHHLAR